MDIYQKEYLDPNLQLNFVPRKPRQETIDTLALYEFTDNAGRPIEWTSGQLEIIDCILHRSSPDGMKRIQIIASTQYGKSLAVAAGVVIRASAFPEKWALVAGTKEKARIIMEAIVMLALNNVIIRQELDPETPMDRLRMKRSIDRLVFKLKGEVRVFSAEANRVSETSKALMGMGAPNLVQDEAALVNDTLQATIVRMLGGSKDNFMVKIGNPFNRGHFYRTWVLGNYYRIFIDYQRALDEGRYTEDFINEMAQEALFDILYECKFPREGKIDAKGWLQLLTSVELERAFVEENPLLGYRRLGCDVAGGGRNYSVIVARGYNVAKKIYKENEPDTMAFAGQVVVQSKTWTVAGKDIFVDLVGIGRGAFDRLKELILDVVGVGGGSTSSQNTRFANLRAEMYWRAREWVLAGGKLEKDPDWYQLSDVKWKADSNGKIKLMSKEEMLAQGIDSPDVADAFAMTFVRSDQAPALREQQEEYSSMPEEDINDDPYESL